MLSFAQRVLRYNRPFVLFHTWTVTRELLEQAIRGERSMDLDVCVDDAGNPYLGHPREYHEKTQEPCFNSMPLEEAVEALARSSIPAIVDCKHFNAWPVVEQIVRRLHPERCLVHAFVSELKFDAGRGPGEPDFLERVVLHCIVAHAEKKIPVADHYRERQVAPAKRACFGGARIAPPSDRRDAQEISGRHPLPQCAGFDVFRQGSKAVSATRHSCPRQG
jgi:hypothetical protein